MLRRLLFLGRQPPKEIDEEIANLPRPKSQADVDFIREKLALFCNICQLSNGPQTRHCRFCNGCIDTFDHQYVFRILLPF